MVPTSNKENKYGVAWKRTTMNPRTEVVDLTLYDPLNPSYSEVETQTLKQRMDPLLWHKVAAISGVAAVGLGAYGSHLFKPKNPVYKEVWQTASVYHLAHSVALLAAPITKRPNIFGGLLTAGIIAFSGTCYAVALLEDRKYSAPAPFGGFAFMAAWASLLF